MRKVRSLCVFLLLVVLFSCSTGNLRNGKVPYWYYKPQESANNYEVAFVSEGVAETERQALLVAYSALNDKIYEYLGLEPDEEAYRELSMTGTIAAFNVRIAEKFLVNTDGVYTVYILATADKKLISDVRTQTKFEEDEIADTARKLILEGDELIKTNQDILGLKKYMQSLALSYGLTQIEKEYSFDEILKEVEYIIETTDIEISSRDMHSAKCRLTVKRRETLIPSKIANCPIVAHYNSRDSRNRIYEDAFVFITDSGGTVAFEPKNHFIEMVGKVFFNIDVYSELNQIERVSEIAAERIKNALEKTAIRFDYILEYDEKKFGFCMLELDEKRNYINSAFLNKALKRNFDSDNVYSVGFAVDRTDFRDEELLKKVAVHSSDIGYLVIGRAMVSDYIQSKNNIFGVTAEGNVKVFNVKTGELIFDSGIVYSNGFSQTKEGAKDASFENLSRLFHSLIKVYYV